jgi:hypothetical protein
MVAASRCPLVPDHENVHADREGAVSRRHLGRFGKCDFTKTLIPGLPMCGCPIAFLRGYSSLPRSISRPLDS